MLKSAVTTISLVYLMLASIRTVLAADLVAYTEEWAPYNFTENGKLVGISTDFLLAACERAKVSCQIESVPWARAYEMAKASPDTLVYTTARDASREAEFLWLGPILPRATWVFGRRDSPRLASYAELATAHIGVVNEDAAIRDLLFKGVPKQSLDFAVSTETNFRKFAAARVDYITGTEVGVAWDAQQYDLPFQPIKLLPLSESGSYYYAMNPKSNPLIAKKLQQALDDLRETGLVAKLVAKYSAKSHAR